MPPTTTASSLVDFLKDCDRIVHGTTVATNRLVEGKTATTGFLCNAGHPDILTLREAPRKRCFDFRLDFPKPYVPRRHTAQVRGRIDAFGGEVEPFNEDDRPQRHRHVPQARRRGDRDLLPVVDREPGARTAREGDRARVVAGDAGDAQPRAQPDSARIPARDLDRDRRLLHPIVSAYTDALRHALAEHDFNTDHFLFATCNGGMMPPAAVVEKPIFSVMSGPTLAPVAAQRLRPEPDVIVVDMGGTTFDVAAIRDRRLIVTAEAMLGDDNAGVSRRSTSAPSGRAAAASAGWTLPA